jgi:hypothetical protein
MAIVYNWVVTSMEAYPKTSDNLTDVVFKIHWRRQATETLDDKTYFADIYDVLSVAAPSPENFIPYEDLTFEQVCGWLEAGLDFEKIDQSLVLQLEKDINPTTIELPLPWNDKPIKVEIIN